MAESLRDQVLIIDPEVKRRLAYRLGYGDQLGEKLNIKGKRDKGLIYITSMSGLLGLVVADVETELNPSGVEVKDLVKAALEARIPHVVVTTREGNQSDFPVMDGVLVLARNEVLRNLPEYFV